MRIDLQQPHKSIASLTTGELPDFAVLIGRNGAGKTQLLDALKEGHAVVSGIGLDDIELYDMTSFRPPNVNVGNRGFNQFGKSAADAFLLAPPGKRPPVETAAEIFDKFAGESEADSGADEHEEFVRNLKNKIQRMPNFTFFPPSQDQKSTYHRTLFTHVMRPFIPQQSSGRQRNKQSNPPANSFNGNQAALLSTAMKLADKLPHELTRDDIMRASYYEGATLSNVISEVFASYKVDQFVWAHTRIETEPADFEDLVAEYRAKYPPPWETFRDILSGMREAAGDEGLFDFDFSDPDGHRLDMGNYEQFSFKTEMTNRTSGAQYELDSLSSGEKVLMALCLTSFNHYLGRRRPKLLLLDELDAVLHPSMVAALVTTLKSLFVPHGTRVLMTSHSAMTVAALDESDIFRVVRKEGHVSVSRSTKSEAISELSEGLATVDAGLRIAAYNAARVTILTEGHNARHLKRWVQLNFAQDVHVFEDLPQYRSASELLTYGRLLVRMITNAHFVIVWDCDAAEQAESLRRELPHACKVTPFAFKKRKDNKIARRGIENIYDEKILEPFTIKKFDSNDRFLGREFPKNQKTEFANHVQEEGTVDYFTHFGELYSVVRGLLGSEESESQASPRADIEPTLNQH